jgi:hypothetical protein
MVGVSKFASAIPSKNQRPLYLKVSALPHSSIVS